MSAQTNIYGQNWKDITASCPTGETALSAGVELIGHSNDEPVVAQLHPVDTHSWYAKMIEAQAGDETDWGIRLRLLCVRL